MSRGAPNLVCSKRFRGSHLNVEKTHARKKLCKNGKCPYFFTCLRFETPGFSVVQSSGRPASQAKWHRARTKTANTISQRHVGIIHSDLDGSQAKGFLRCVGNHTWRFSVPRFLQSTTTPIFWSFFTEKSQVPLFWPPDLLMTCIMHTHTHTHTHTHPRTHMAHTHTHTEAHTHLTQRAARQSLQVAKQKLLKMPFFFSPFKSLSSSPPKMGGPTTLTRGFYLQLKLQFRPGRIGPPERIGSRAAKNRHRIGSA
jgi:hypothetical protein